MVGSTLVSNNLIFSDDIPVDIQLVFFLIAIQYYLTKHWDKN